MLETEKNYIVIENEKFELIDEADNIPIPDCFVKINKIQGTSGHGEAKLYVGAQQKTNFGAFFDNFESDAFFLKQDLAKYLNDAKFEYEQQEQKYRLDISKNWDKYHQDIQNLANQEFFKIKRAVPQDKKRFYITSKDNIYNLFRSIALPLISFISILKLKNNNGNISYLFRPVLSYSFNPYYHPAKIKAVEKSIESNSTLTPEIKIQLKKARRGQGLYRKKLLDESSECIITRVNDERMLIASHIKPWSVSTDIEKVDHNNGLALTPTYDRLFDQGFISFENDGLLLISPYISPLNIKKMNLSQGRKYTIPMSESRQNYLSYHREHIFKK